MRHSCKTDMASASLPPRPAAAAPLAACHPASLSSACLMSNGDVTRLDQLTGLRFIAALLVFLSHVPWPSAPDWLQTMLAQGFVGVSFFFVLSGFVLSHSYATRITCGDMTYGRFMALRLARLSPLHLATALPYVLVGIWRNNLTAPVALLNLSFLQSWVPDSTYYLSLNAPSWSLSNEMFFYLCFFPLCFVAAPRRWLLTALLAMTVAACAAYAVTHYNSVILIGERTVGHWVFYIFPGFRLLEFLAGMALYDVWQRGLRLPRSALPLAWALLFAAMFVADRIPEAVRMSLFFLPVVTLLLYVHLDRAPALCRILSGRAMVLLGEASFALYMIHQPAIRICNRLIGDLPHRDLFVAAAAFALAIVASLVLFIYFERPAERGLKAWVNRRTSRQRRPAE